MKALLALSLALLLFARPARAERFVTNILLDVKCAAADSTICSFIAAKGQVLAFWAQQSRQPIGNLELVYDTDADEIQVVKKSDGEVVGTHMGFCDGATLANDKDTHR